MVPGVTIHEQPFAFDGALWDCSVVAVGQTWYSFGWETQLLETGFLAIWLVPLLSLQPVPSFAPPVVILWAYRWLIFRIMLGAVRQCRRLCAHRLQLCCVIPLSSFTLLLLLLPDRA